MWKRRRKPGHSGTALTIELVAGELEFLQSSQGTQRFRNVPCGYLAPKVGYQCSQKYETNYTAAVSIFRNQRDGNATVAAEESAEEREAQAQKLNHGTPAFEPPRQIVGGRIVFVAGAMLWQDVSLTATF